MRLEDGLSHLLELDFEHARIIEAEDYNIGDENSRYPAEWGQIAIERIREDETKTVVYGPRQLIFGFYKDAKSGKTFLIHKRDRLFLSKKSTPIATNIEDIRGYIKLEVYQPNSK